MKNWQILLIACGISLLLGFWICRLLYPSGTSNNATGVAGQTTISGKPQIITQTIIKYIEKASGEATDIEANFNKPEIHVMINGQPAIITMASNESFVFEKNKIVLNQTSAATFEIKVQPVDLTRHYGIGLGLGFNGLSGIGTYPLNNMLDFWATIDRVQAAGGVMIRF